MYRVENFQPVVLTIDCLLAAYSLLQVKGGKYFRQKVRTTPIGRKTGEFCCCLKCFGVFGELTKDQLRSRLDACSLDDAKLKAGLSTRSPLLKPAFGILLSLFFIAHTSQA